MSLIGFDPRWKDFPCLEMAYAAGRAAGTMPCVLNAANEVAVESFLKEKIGFMDIPRICEKVMSEHKTIPKPDLDDILDTDNWARSRAREFGRACNKG